MQPVFFLKILGIPLFSYTTSILASIVLALVIAQRNARREGFSSTWVLEAFALMVPLALLSGRVFQWILSAEYYRERPEQWLNFGDGGLSFVGVALGGLAGLWLWSRRRRVAWSRAADAAALPITLVACGAWLGAFTRGSQYGSPADNLIALELHDLYGVVDLRWPTQLLAAVWCAMLGLGLLMMQERSKDSTHVRTILFLSLYSMGMFILDFTRGDPSIYILGFRPTQWLYLVIILLIAVNLGRKYVYALTKSTKITRI